MSGRNRPEGLGAGAARAVIDIGSNTVRLVIYGGPPRAPVILHNEKVTARLGKALGETGLLGEKQQNAALAALARYRILLDLFGVQDTRVVATAATREAANGPAFLEKVRALGFTVRQLSGEEEAVFSAEGVAAAFPGARGTIADLGGGSLELTRMAESGAERAISLPLGTLRLPALRSGGSPSLSARVNQMLEDSGWPAATGGTLFLVGGSLRAFARFAMIRQEWPVDDPHGFALAPDEALKLARSAMRKAPELPLSLPGISTGRVAALPDAAALLAVLVERFAPSQLVFSSWGLREGVLFEGSDAATMRQDPLVAGVSQFAASRGTGPSDAAAVAGWTVAANRPDSAAPESLRLAAVMLALASSRIEPNLRAGEGLDWALRKRWIGIGTRGRALLAAAILGNTGRTDKLAELERLATPDDIADAQGWGLAVRLCRRFSGGAAPVLARSRLSRNGDELHLAVTEDFAALVNDGVERDLKALAAHLGLRPVLSTTPA